MAAKIPTVGYQHREASTLNLLKPHEIEDNLVCYGAWDGCAF